MLRNENIPVVHQVHAYDDADVALTMALPWVHELGWPLGQCDSAAGPRTCFVTWLSLRRLVINSLEVAFSGRPHHRGHPSQSIPFIEAPFSAGRWDDEKCGDSALLLRALTR